MSMARAVRQCPDLVIVRPDFARYRAASQQVFAIFRSCTSLVEPLSLDEAYLDVTDNLWGEPVRGCAAGLVLSRRSHTVAEARCDMSGPPAQVRLRSIGVP